MSPRAVIGGGRVVPKTSYYWWREYRGIWGAMDGFPTLTDDFGVNWVFKMRRHYAARLRKMYVQRPCNIRLDDLRAIPDIIEGQHEEVQS